MTRDEAVAIAKKSRDWGSGSSEFWLVNALAALGVLKLDGTKGPNQRAIDAMFRVCEGGVLTPRVAMSVIEAAGLQIIEKQGS